jgi:hypothetical protein
MQTPSDIPYWMRSLGRLAAEPQLPFGVKLTLLRLLRVEGATGLLQTHPSLF